jgi:DNA topoisomerase-1
MARTKKNEKNYVPLDKSSLGHSIEVSVKEIKDEDLIKIEKGEGKVKLKTRTIKEETEEPAEEAKEKAYTLIITEKPQAAEKIANALAQPKRYYENKVPYYELEKGGKKIIVACAVGHLFTLTTKEKGWPIFKISWKADFKRNPWAKKYYQLLKKLVRNASDFVIATDYDIEGEVIGWNIIRFIAKQKDAKRMKFSALTKSELEKSYKKPEPTVNWGQAIAGETRHFLDWMYGINLSRALMSAIKKAGRFKILSIGRVQGPALNLIAAKELAIKKFKPEPYWQIFVKLEGHALSLKYEKDIKKKKELDKFKDLKGKEGHAETKKAIRNLQPPFPFELTSLQREAYRLYKISPSRTLQLAQNLYLAGIISYPRTSSQKIPASIKPKEILKKLSTKFEEVKFATREKPVEGKKTDPAHPSIYPTGDSAKMSEEEAKIYRLIAKRFISCFCKDAEIQNKKIVFSVDKLKFLARGLEIKDKGWLNVYPATIKEQKIEDIEGKKKVRETSIEEKQTQPPKRYTPASIITELEKKNLGTKATRAGIIETLYNRNYIKEQAVQATPLGIKLISSLSKYSPIIIDEKLTRHFEREMQRIQEAKKNLQNLQDITLKEAKKTIEKISEDIKKNEEKIGKELVKANQEIWEQERAEKMIGKCPVCKKGSLRILYNRKSKRYFVGCSAYPECKTTFSLPPNSLIKPANKTCEHCGFQKLLSIRRGKRPWEFCFNPECESNKHWQNKKNNYKSKSQ